MIPRHERELLEQVLEEFDDAMDNSLVIVTGLRKHPDIDTITCASVRFAPGLAVDKVQAALAAIHKKYTNKDVTCRVGDFGKEFLFWFEGNPKTLRAEWTMEIAQDLFARGINPHEEIRMANEIAKSIDDEIVRSLYDGIATSPKHTDIKTD